MSRPEPLAASPPAALAEADSSGSRAVEKKKEAPAAQAQDQLLTAGQASGKQAAVAATAYLQSGPASLAGKLAPLAALPEGAPLRQFTQRGPLVWAVSDGGRIFRSTDSGQTWTKLESPTTNDLVRVVWESESGLLVEDKQGQQYRIKP